MNPERKTKWLQYLSGVIEREVNQAAILEKARNEADGKMQSRYDTQKENFALDLSIVLNSLDHTREMYGEIEHSNTRDAAIPGASLMLSFNGDQEEDFLLLRTHGSLPDTQVITPSSPIGKSLIGKRTGENVVYTANSRVFNVAIRKIE